MQQKNERAPNQTFPLVWQGCAWRHRQVSPIERHLSAIRALYAYMAAKGYVHGNSSKLVRVDLRKLSHDQREPGQTTGRRQIFQSTCDAEDLWV